MSRLFGSPFTLSKAPLWIVAVLAVLIGCDASAETSASAASQQPPVARQSAATAPQVVHLEPTAIDCGPMGHQEKRTVEFQIKNPTTRALPITRVWASCGCIKVEFDQRPLKPGETRRGKLRISFGRGYSYFKKQVEFDIDRKKLVLPVRANFHPGVKVLTPSTGRALHEFVLYGVVGKTHPEGKGHALVQGTSKMAVANVRATLNDGSPHPHVTATATVADGRAPVQVSLSPTHPAGIVQGRVRMDVNGLTLLIPFRGRVYQGIRTKPDVLNFNRIDDVASAEQRVRLTPVDGKEFTVESTQIVPRPRTVTGSLVITVEPVANGGGYDIVARLKEPYPAPGSRLGGVVTVQTTHPECPKIELQYLGFVAKPRPPRRKSSIPPRRKGT